MSELTRATTQMYKLTICSKHIMNASRNILIKWEKNTITWSFQGKYNERKQWSKWVLKGVFQSVCKKIVSTKFPGFGEPCWLFCTKQRMRSWRYRAKRFSFVYKIKHRVIKYNKVIPQPESVVCKFDRH